MEIVAILRVLWHRKLPVAVGAVFAVAAGVFALGGADPPRAAAVTRLMLDTPRSQLITDSPDGADTLAWRAGLLASLMGSDPVKRQIAGQLRIRPNELATVDPPLSRPRIPTSLPRTASEAASLTPEPYVLTVGFENDLPIIFIEAVAPDPNGAARLANAAADALEESDSPRATELLQGFVIERVAPIQAAALPTGHGRLAAIGIAVVLFGLWCACLIALTAVARARRQRAVAQPA